MSLSVHIPNIYICLHMSHICTTFSGFIPILFYGYFFPWGWAQQMAETTEKMEVSIWEFNLCCEFIKESDEWLSFMLLFEQGWSTSAALSVPKKVQKHVKFPDLLLVFAVYLNSKSVSKERCSNRVSNLSTKSLKNTRKSCSRSFLPES